MASTVDAASREAVVLEKSQPGAFPLVVDGRPARLIVSKREWPGVARVARLLCDDLERVSGVRPELHEVAPDTSVDTPMAASPGPAVVIGTLGRGGLVDQLVRDKRLDVADLQGKREKFAIVKIDSLEEADAPTLVIAGSDKRGAIYGMFDLAAQAGVSPWHWWADVPPSRRGDLWVAPGRHTLGEPAVEFRGIFINDEAPALAGWAHEKFGGCNSEFYAKVFELILRLRGNYLWPAMWGRSLFDDDPRSQRLADEYGVVIGTSHHEPMMRAHVEWRRYGEGPWNYDKNRDALREFWREGIRRMDSCESFVTIGMRGDGD
ncbi:MAG: glycosyl hydrolase 115 family protein, partial [Planctomycetales bacterium]|nr:glycosyl hydrolase 115 family protein [Planctomycetales bacterium]